MTAYVIAQMAVHDVEGYRQYAMAVMSNIQQGGGKVLAANDAAIAFEGAPPYPRTVIGEFPSVEAARAWYDSPEYAAIKHLRIDATTSVVFVVEGMTLPEAPHSAAGATA
jgi:uncharacterized protein (DUF1330 family)